MKWHYMEGLPFYLAPRESERQRLINRARGGNIDAALAAASMLFAGEGGAAELPLACELLQGAAQSGSAEAQLMLGGILFTVPGREVDGLKWLHQAADAGLAEAVYLLGVAYARGQGVPSDREGARRLLRRAARAGIPEASLELERIVAD
jgi:TPR repeat protein